MIEKGVTIDLHGTKRIGMKLSGGPDSAMILYMICKKITDENIDIEYIQPITATADVKPYNIKFARRVIEWMRNRYPNIEIKDTHCAVCKYEEYNSRQEELVRDLILNRDIDITFAGITANPPDEEGKNFWPCNPKYTRAIELDFDGHPEDISNADWNTRAVERDEPDVEVYWSSWRGKDEKVPMVRPFINHDKRKVAELYHHYDIMELFDITRSCENINGPALNDFEDHCETECWWCYERRWAFGRV